MGSDSPAWKLQLECDREAKAAKNALQVRSPKVTLQYYKRFNQQRYPNSSTRIFLTSAHITVWNSFNLFQSFKRNCAWRIVVQALPSRRPGLGSLQHLFTEWYLLLYTVFSSVNENTCFTSLPWGLREIIPWADLAENLLSIIVPILSPGLEELWTLYWLCSLSKY